MGTKAISGIRMKNGMDEIISTTGVVSPSGKFVVAAQGRFNTGMKWTPTRKNNGTDSHIPMRLDISVSHYDETTGQGEFVMPYLSGRVIQIKGSFGSRTIVATPFDNDTVRQYKNALVSQDIWDAMKESIKIAIHEAVECSKNGKTMATASNSEFIDNADEFLNVAEKVAKQNAASAAAAGATIDATLSPGSNAEQVGKILGQ